MDLEKRHKYNKKIFIMVILAIISIILFMTLEVDLKHYEYAMKIRTPKIITICIAAFCIGIATVVFQAIINSTVISPSLLGINSLYVLVHTTIIFLFGSLSPIVSNKNLLFIVGLLIMSVSSFVIYGAFFKKVKGNILYVMLMGTVLSTFFSSFTSAMQRLISPSDFLSLQSSLYASFTKVNSEIIVLSLVILGVVAILIRKELKLLDVISLGKHTAINLGVDYTKTIGKLLLFVTILISVATALVGPISFLGLIVSNIAREIFKTYKSKYLMLGSALIGVIMLVVGQGIVEHIFNFKTNINIFINIGGGLYFLYLILKNRR